MRFERYDANGNHIAGGSAAGVGHVPAQRDVRPQDRLWIDFSSGGDGTKQLARIAEDGSFADATRRIVSGGDLVSIDALDSGMLFMIKRTPTGGPDGSPDATLYALNADGSERWFHPAHADMPTMLAVHLSPQRVRVLEAGLHRRVRGESPISTRRLARPSPVRPRCLGQRSSAAGYRWCVHVTTVPSYLRGMTTTNSYSYSAASGRSMRRHSPMPRPRWPASG